MELDLFPESLDLVLDFELVSPPTVGTISISSSGQAIYTAPPFITGSDPLNVFFEYKVTDGGGCVKRYSLVPHTSLFFGILMYIAHKHKT